MSCVLLEERLIVGLLAEAAPDKVIWHALVPPPISVRGLQLTEVTARFEFDCPRRVSDCETPWFGAEMTTELVADTADAVAVNVALVNPVPMVITAGTLTVALDEFKLTAVGDCAALPRLKVHVVEPGV